MKLKKILALTLASAMAFSLIGCGSKTTTNPSVTDTPKATATETPKSTDAPEATATPTPELTEAADLSDIIPAETLTLNVYTQLANYEGIQIGWFGDVMLEKFNVKLNIINEGDGVFSTRMESGDLGDLVVFGNDGDQYKQAAEKGMLFDWEDEDLVQNYGPTIVKNMSPALEKNKKISGGKLYGFGHNVALNGGSFGDFDYHPDIRWDLYQQIGSPAINTLEDYVDVLKKMKEICPTSDSGKETYGVSLFNDWDGNMVMFVKATATNFFGVDEFHFGFYNADDGSFQDTLADNGYYLRCLKFYNTLFQNGLLDPDSMTQGYNGCLEDFQDGGAFFNIFSWMAAPQYNTDEHIAAGKKMLPVAAKDQDTLVYGLNTNGGNRIWSIGANTKYPELCMAIINWLTTTEGYLTSEYGPKDLCWEYLSDGSVDLTEFGLQCIMNNQVTMPAPYTGYWIDGRQQINNITWDKNTEILGGVNGQTYNYLYWPRYLSLPVSEVDQSWRDATQTDSFREYLSQFTYSIAKAHTYSDSVRSEELDTTWNQVKDCIKNGSWKAIYAKTDAEFNEIVAQMKADAINYGYQQCIEWSANEATLRHAAENK